MTTFGILTSGFESVTVNGQDRFGTFIIIIKVVKLRILMARMKITRGFGGPNYLYEAVILYIV